MELFQFLRYSILGSFECVLSRPFIYHSIEKLEVHVYYVRIDAVAIHKLLPKERQDTLVCKS